jgi:hypothetical protein
MPNRLALVGAVFAAIAALLGPQRASADGNLVLYCAVHEEWCRNMVAAFERQTGIKVAMTRKSSGEFYAQVQAEASNPRSDIWWGGTGDPHMQAAEESLTIQYESPNLAKCMIGQKHNGGNRNTARSASMPARWATAAIPSYCKKTASPNPNPADPRRPSVCYRSDAADFRLQYRDHP